MRRGLLAAVSERAEAFLEQWPGAQDGEPHATHQARVAARRLAEVLPLAGATGERLARRVRAVRRALGAGREMDVAIDLLGYEAAERQWPGPAVGRLRAYLESERDRRRSEARKALDDFDSGRLRRGIRALGETVAHTASSDIRRRLTERRVERTRTLTKAIRRAGAMYDVERLHAVRLATKKLRYVLEVSGEVLGQKTAPTVAALKGAQEDLGRLHDLQVLHMEARALENTLVPGRGRVAKGLSGIANDIDAACRVLHGRVMETMKKINELTS